MRKDYIDSCVFLGYALDKNANCQNYIQTIGYNNRNKATISHFVLSEILYTIIIKLKYEKDHITEYILKETAFKLIDNTINELIKKKYLIVNRLKTNIINEDLLRELQNIDNRLSEDDIFHIIEAIVNECDFFVTSDKEIISNSKLREHLSRNHKIKILEIKL